MISANTRMPVILALTSFLSVLIIRHLPIYAYLPSTLTSYDRHIPRQNVHLVTPQSLRSKMTTTAMILLLSNRYIEIPLLDILPSNDDDNDDGNMKKKKKKKADVLVQPLPSMHLQHPELQLIHMYGMKLTVPLYQQIINHAWDKTAMNAESSDRIYFDDDDMTPQERDQKPYKDPTKVPLVGILAYKPPTRSTAENRAATHPVIGAVGCIVQVIYNDADSNDNAQKQSLIDNDDISEDGTNKKKKKSIKYNTPSTSKTVLCRGLFRFIVREIKQSIPYTVALVEELIDDNENDALPVESKSMIENDSANTYANMTTTELMQRTLQSMQVKINRLMENAIREVNRPLTPLEESILQDNGMMDQQQIIRDEIRDTAQRYESIWNIFRASLVDMTPKERYYSVPIMAAEIWDFNNTIRRQMIVTRNPIERLRIACRAAEATSSSIGKRTSDVISISTAMSAQPTFNSAVPDSVVGGGIGGNSRTGSSKDLSVGTPKLPSWSKQIKKGTILEYYWNEEYGWCRGQVIEDPLRIVPEEMVLTIHFPDDKSTHRLPFSADEKVRWRPPTSSAR